MKIAFYMTKIPDLNTTPPLGPLMLIACLEQEGFQCKLFDGRIDNNAFDNLLKFAPDIVGFSSVTPGYLKSIELAEIVKQKFPGIPIIFGGPHPSILPDEVIIQPCVDYVLTGESEISIAELCNKIRINDVSYSSLLEVNNLVFCYNNKIVHTDKIDNLTGIELDSLPWPAFHSMDLERYFYSSQTHGIFKKGKKILPIMTSRGCPHNCTFCCRIMGNKIRYRNIDLVLDEIRFLVDTYNIDELYVEDDNFTFDRNRAFEFLEKMASFKPKIFLKFANGIRADLVDEQLLNAMRKANVYYVGFGIESGCKSTLINMKKGLSLSKAKQNVILAKSLGFKVGANCIIGYPGETIENIRESLNFFLSLPLDSMAIVNLVPFPGTEVRDMCKDNGYLTEYADDWDNYYFSINAPIPLIETSVLSRAHLVKEVHRAYRKMYLRPKWIINNIRHFSLRQIIVGISLLLKKGM